MTDVTVDQVGDFEAAAQRAHRQAAAQDRHCLLRARAVRARSHRSVRVPDLAGVPGRGPALLLAAAVVLRELRVPVRAHELLALGPQHVDLRDGHDAHPPRHRVAGRLRVREDALSGSSGALLPRPRHADGAARGAARSALPHRQGSRPAEHVLGADPADGREPARRLHDAPVHRDASRRASTKRRVSTVRRSGRSSGGW